LLRERRPNDTGCAQAIAQAVRIDAQSSFFERNCLVLARIQAALMTSNADMGIKRAIYNASSSVEALETRAITASGA
jgi:hypothetical protein